MPPPSKSQPSVAPHEKNSPQLGDAVTTPPESQSSSTTLPSQLAPNDVQQKDNPTDREIDGLGRDVQGLDLTERKDRDDSESSEDVQENGALKRETSFEDDRTHLSNSSTKPTSFDSKSMASVTTFAMDEKDSLRPDDSASVQAADEEESLSGPASGAPNSLTGSESGARGFRDHSQRTRGALQSTGPGFNDGGLQISGAIPPDSVSNNFVMPNPETFQGGRTLHGFPLEPDEKLLEAMNSPKDRLLILQLEEKIRAFIQDSKEQTLDLPPSNAFGRLLAHKLGDYYHLAHFVDNSMSSVRLHKTPFCRLPTPLSMLQPANANNTPPPNAPAMKIMRRVGQPGERPSAGGSTAASSSAPSKATSEAGGEGGNDEQRAGSSAGATPAKDRTTMTREEREAKYQEARERIFRDFPESKSSENNNGEHSTNNMSRSSSTSGRKKNHKQKTPHDDTFEVRSQFNVYYPGMPYVSSQVPFNVAMNDGSFPAQHPYMVGPGASPPAMTYIQNGQNNAMYPAHMNVNPFPPYPIAVSPHVAQNNTWQSGHLPQQSPYPGFTSVNQPSPMMGQPSSTRSSPAMNNHAIPHSAQYQQTPSTWASPPYQGNFQQSSQRNPPPVHWPNYPSQPMASSPVSYPYGQLPGQPFNPGVQNHSAQHPMPGSFNRSPFNPQTRSFVPGSASPARFPGKGNQHGVNSSYHSPQSKTQQQWTGFQDNSGHSNNGTSQAGGKNSGSAASGHHTSTRTTSAGNRDSIAKWGTPSHLPPKPPPSEVPSDFDMKNRNASASTHSCSNNSLPNSKNGPLVVSGGTSLPKPN